MEARILRNLALVAILFSFGASLSFGASHRTQNFIVMAETKELAIEVGNAAERYRRGLAIEWLGQELPPWGGQNICPITVKSGPNMLAGGVTSFAFDRGRPFEWTMEVRGTRERVLDSVLPHEITHTIFATHFGRPLPRWADEGACTVVEHVSERQKQYDMLMEFLTTNRGIAFNRMFAMREYPNDILPLYAQGYTLARYLIAQGGKQKFVRYVGDGMQSNDWTAATKKHYQFRDLSELQVTWLNWIKKSSPLDLVQHPQLLARDSVMRRNGNASLVASNSNSLTPDAINTHNGMAPFGRQPRPVAADLSTRPNTFNSTADYQVPSGQPENYAVEQPATNSLAGQQITATNTGNGWYARQRDSVGHQVANNSASGAQPPITLAPQPVTSDLVNAPRQFNHSNLAIDQAQPLSQFQLQQQQATRNQQILQAQRLIENHNRQVAPQQLNNGVVLAQPKRPEDARAVDGSRWQSSPSNSNAYTAVRPMAPQRPQQTVVEPSRGGGSSSRGYEQFDTLPMRR